MKKMYSVIESVNHDGKDYEPGTSLELEEAQATPLLALGKIKEPFGERQSTMPPAGESTPVAPSTEADLLQNSQQKGIREAQLRKLFADEGWGPIQAIAKTHGIVKPVKGWDEAIPLILEKEFPPDNQPPLTTP